jgi:hypothetical protein
MTGAPSGASGFERGALRLKELLNIAGCPVFQNRNGAKSPGAKSGTCLRDIFPPRKPDFGLKNFLAPSLAAVATWSRRTRF